MGNQSVKLIANNKKAYHDYFIEDTFEAGIALHGTEVKSLRMGKCSIKEAFIRVENGEVFVYGMQMCIRDSVYTEGITKITATDIRYAREMGCDIKLVGVCLLYTSRCV